MLLLAIYTECEYCVKQNGLNLQIHNYINLSTRLQKSAYVYIRKYADKNVQCVYCVFPPLTTFSTLFHSFSKHFSNIGMIQDSNK